MRKGPHGFYGFGFPGSVSSQESKMASKKEKEKLRY